MSGRCIAGRELGDEVGAWLRPVSDRHEEVSEHDRRYADGSDPHVLDIVDIPLIAPRANRHQPENWLAAREARPKTGYSPVASSLRTWIDSSILLRHSGLTGTSRSTARTIESPTIVQLASGVL